MIKKILAVFGAILFAGAIASAQTNVTGKVTDAAGEPVIGAGVTLKSNPTKGTITDIDGNYAITVSDKDVLVFEALGYEKVEILVGNQTVINAIFKQQATVLDDVVVVGYGTQKKRDLTGAIASMSNKDFKTQSTNNIQNLLQGRLAGVNVQTSGVSGEAPSIRIRGIGTLNDNTPLYVIDGIPTKSDVAAQLSPSSIESLQVLKDAASASIYGAQASNGVILITTKQGSKGAPTFNVSLNAGVRLPQGLPDMLDPQQYGEMLWTANKNAGITPSHAIYGNGANPVIPEYIFPAGATSVDLSKYDTGDNQYMKANKEGTKWFKEVFRPASTFQVNFNATGGNERGKFFTDVNYLNEDQLARYAGYQKISLRNNATYSLNNWITVGSNLSASYSKYQGGTTSASAATTPEIIPVYDVMGNWAGTKAPGVGDGTNPVASLYNQKDNYSTHLNVLANMFLDVKFLKWFTFRSTAGANIIRYDSKSFNPTTYWNRGDKNTLVNSLSQNAKTTTEVTWNNTLTFDKDFGKHHLNVLLGTEAIWQNYSELGASRSNFLVEDVDYRYLSAGEDELNNWGSGSAYSLFSLFARANYSYDNRYYLSAVIRRDGSSRFGPNNRYGVFPGVSAAWRISGESFMEDQNVFSDLKLRASFGKNGNQEIGNYAFASTYGYEIRYNTYPIDGVYNQLVQGIANASIGNPDIRWETSTQYNVGLDMGFFDNSLTASLEWYDKTTTDILQQPSMPATAGMATAPYQNIGSMRNRGLEFAVNYYSPQYGDFRYELGGVFSTYKNKVLYMADHQIITNTYTRTEEGMPISYFYGYKIEGIFQTQEEVDNSAPWKAVGNTTNQVGTWKFQDTDENGVINSEDRTYLGSPHPDLEYSLTGRLYWKNFDMMIFMQGTIGNEICFSSNHGQTGLALIGGDFNKSTAVLDTWSETNRDAKLPKMTTNLAATTTQVTSFLIENGSYFRIKNLEIGYTLPRKASKKIGLNNLRVYLNSENLLTVTSYSGLDPEVRNTNDKNFGVDNISRMPLPRIFSAGVNITF